MDWMNQVENIFQRYSGQGGGAVAAAEDPHGDFQQVAQSAPQEVVADGIAQAFRSDQTPSFPQMVGKLFSQSDPNQRAGLLSRLLDSSVSPQQANQTQPAQVEQMAAQAEKQRPSIVDEVSGFYAQHPQVM